MQREPEETHAQSQWNVGWPSVRVACRDRSTMRVTHKRCITSSQTWVTEQNLYPKSEDWGSSMTKVVCTRGRNSAPRIWIKPTSKLKETKHKEGYRPLGICGGDGGGGGGGGRKHEENCLPLVPGMCRWDLKAGCEGEKYNKTGWQCTWAGIGTEWTPKQLAGPATGLGQRHRAKGFTLKCTCEC